MTEKKKYKMTNIVAMHYLKLVFRSLLFVLATIIYIYNKVHQTGNTFGGFENNGVVLSFIWIVFTLEMALRFFPARLESMGCQKQFQKNYIPIAREEDSARTKDNSYITAAICWAILNGILGVLYLTGIFDRGIMLLIALFYSVCDIICILFFCPFQTWIMKNKCCTTCRIYNWDYAMMFTPLLFVKNIYSWTLFGMALILLIKWEYIAHRYPERFSEEHNKSLQCTNCDERLCQHKLQLQSFLMKGNFNLRGNFLYKKYIELGRETKNGEKFNSS